MEYRLLEILVSNTFHIVPEKKKLVGKGKKKKKRVNIKKKIGKEEIKIGVIFYKKSI